MLITPNMQADGGLNLDAFSFSSDELNSVSKAISNSGIQPDYSSLPQDRRGRTGRRYSIRKGDVSKFESFHGIKFESAGVFRKRLRVSFRGKGDSFRCEEVTLHGSGDCQTINANDISQARVVCALLANDNRWFGGVASPGRCGE